MAVSFKLKTLLYSKFFVASEKIYNILNNFFICVNSPFAPQQYTNPTQNFQFNFKTKNHNSEHRNNTESINFFPQTTHK